MSFTDALIIKVYVPLGCRATSLVELTRLAGGCTVCRAAGSWLSLGGSVVTEDVNVVEFVITNDTVLISELLGSAAEAFFKENPKEEAFMATVQTAKRLRKFLVTNEGELNER